MSLIVDRTIQTDHFLAGITVSQNVLLLRLTSRKITNINYFIFYVFCKCRWDAKWIFFYV